MSEETHAECAHAECAHAVAEFLRFNKDEAWHTFAWQEVQRYLPRLQGASAPDTADGLACLICDTYNLQDPHP